MSWMPSGSKAVDERREARKKKEIEKGRREREREREENVKTRRDSCYVK